jgi:uncharacterized RDD family membrane protein YckC
MGQAELSPLWKHEVSQRVAAHKRRKGATATEGGVQSHNKSAGSGRLSSAAARVAARYATAPKYSDLFAGDTISEPIAAEPAPEQIMLLELEAAPVLAAEHVVNVAPVMQAVPAKPVEEAHVSLADAALAMSANWDSDWDFGGSLATPTQHPLSEALERESHREVWHAAVPVLEKATVQLEPLKDPWLEQDRPTIWNESAEDLKDEALAVSMVEPQAIHGNLIEFPNELVAARKVRPRRAEGIYGASVDSEPQLSIFEVDPASISTQPDVVRQVEEAPAWSKPEWADLKLEAKQQPEPMVEPVFEERPAKVVELQAAPINRRLLAAVVDFGLVSLMTVAVAALVVVKADVLPTIREAEIGGGVVFGAIALVYLAISYMLARSTPGMRYALLTLRTFDGRTPTREQRCRRLGAFALAMLPIGLGAVWALFDEQHLSWHDRLSGTYLRRV